MDSQVTTPGRGEPLKASWAAHVAQMVNSHEQMLSARKDASSPNLRSRDRLHPFQIFGGCHNGDATFMIYLPAGCIVYASSTLTPSGVTAVQGMSDRYWVDTTGVGSASAASTLYLVIHSGSSSTSATITIDPTSISSGDTVHVIVPVATIFVQTLDSGDTCGCVSEQIVRSSVAVGAGGGGGGGGSTSGHTGYVDIVTDVFWDTDYFELKKKYRRFTFQDGLLQSIGSEYTSTVFETTAHQNVVS